MCDGLNCYDCPIFFKCKIKLHDTIKDLIRITKKLEVIHDFEGIIKTVNLNNKLVKILNYEN